MAGRALPILVLVVSLAQVGCGMDRPWQPVSSANPGAGEIASRSMQEWIAREVGEKRAEEWTWREGRAGRSLRVLSLGEAQVHDLLAAFNREWGLTGFSLRRSVRTGVAQWDAELWARGSSRQAIENYRAVRAALADSEADGRAFVDSLVIRGDSIALDLRLRQFAGVEGAVQSVAEHLRRRCGGSLSYTTSHIDRRETLHTLIAYLRIADASPLPTLNSDRLGGLAP